MTKSYSASVPTIGRRTKVRGHYIFRRNGYDEVIFSIRSDDWPPNKGEGALHI